MRNKNRLNPLLKILVFPSSFLFIIVVIAIGMFYYAFGITEPEGVSLASWPNRFTNNFSIWMENDKGKIKVKEIGLERLDKYGLWLQVIDETGKEVFSHNKPDKYPEKYVTSELISLQINNDKHEDTIFVSSYKSSGKTWNYLICFPYSIGKHMLYYNGENIGRLSPLFRIVILFCLCMVILFTIFYVFWLTKHLRKISKGINNLSVRHYTKLPEKGIFSDIYLSLNNMDVEIRRIDQAGMDTERIRKEWIANITHDLKTPLSPIKGYAELLMGSITFDDEVIKKYGSIILKNVNHTENMINDLKLTYQLDSGVVPFHPQAVNLVRFLKEIVIDIINDPAFKNYNIEFKNDVQECEALVDVDLFRRAMNNLIINALTHNPTDTKVTISIGLNESQEISICISDNGVGMSDKEQSELFNRYYRGTNTQTKTEGSGLGLAISKQIITLHNGTISVNSKQGEGSRFTIVFPLAGFIT